jgi:outer membrane receptor for ferrienterochelin and colicins
LYGTGAFVAVVNVITKRGRDLDGAEFAADARSLDAYKGRVSYGARFDNGLEALVSGSFFNSQGHQRLFYPEFDSPASNNGIAQDADGNRSYGMFADIIYRDLNIHVVKSAVTKHIPTASFGTVFNDARTRTTDARSYIDAQYHRAFGAWDVLGRASYDWYDYHGIYVYDYEGNGVAPYTENYDAANGSWWDVQGDATRLFFSRHKVTLGTEYRRDIHQRQLNYDIDPYELYFEDHRSSEVWAVYVQDKFAIHKRLALVAGLRNDWRRKYGNTVSPRLGLQFTPARDTGIKIHYSRAFRAPNSYEGFFAGANGETEDPLVRPERIRSWEVDVEHRFLTTYRAAAVGFVNRVDDLIEQTNNLTDPNIDPLNGGPIYRNAGPVRTKGVEFELGSQWPGGQAGSISYSLQDTRYRATGEVLAHSPRHLAKLNLSVPLVPRTIFASVDAQYMSARRTRANTEVGGVFVMNLTVFARRIAQTVDVSGGVYNLLGTRYGDPGVLEHVQASIPQDGRSLRLSLTYRPKAPGRSSR